MVDFSMVEAFLFDLDGTLLDSDDEAVAKTARRLERLGIRHAQRRARRLVMAAETPANTLLTGLDLLGLDESVMGLADRLNHLQAHRTPENFQMVPGVDLALHSLHGRYRLGVVTTRGRRDAERFLAQFELRPLFEVVITRESTLRLKPHPAPVLRAVRELGLSPGRCVMVGDTTVDVRSARRAGAFAVAVLCGFGEQDKLERAGADLILPSPAEIPSALGPGIPLDVLGRT
jgi:HAD superfamily hydrolase (TIGR01509 family)